MDKKLDETILKVRNFNRYYTNVQGFFEHHILESDYSLAEVRVLYEIKNTTACTSKMLIQKLCLDSGYLSRILKRFQRIGLIGKKKSPTDGRSQILHLTEKGKQEIGVLITRQNNEVHNLLEPLPQAAQTDLVHHMVAIEDILENRPINLADITIRTDLYPGDAGYITYMHGWIYEQEYNYGKAFEAYVAKSFYDFLINYSEERDRIWIAEHRGQIVGAIGMVGNGTRGQLRWFLLHPNYRGIGLGSRLLNSAIDWCREKGYKGAYLHTTDDLYQAIGMYSRAGFVKVGATENHTWKDDLTELEFELKFE